VRKKEKSLTPGIEEKGGSRTSQGYDLSRYTVSTPVSASTEMVELDLGLNCSILGIARGPQEGKGE